MRTSLASAEVEDGSRLETPIWNNDGAGSVAFFEAPDAFWVNGVRFAPRASGSGYTNPKNGIVEDPQKYPNQEYPNNDTTINTTMEYHSSQYYAQSSLGGAWFPSAVRKPRSH